MTPLRQYTNRVLLLGATVVAFAGTYAATGHVGWLWQSDYCPEPNVTCGSPPLGLLVSAIVGVALFTAIQVLREYARDAVGRVVA